MTTLVELKYGYDQVGNRLYRRDEKAHALNAGFDELYGYDGLNRLTSFNRGQLGSGNTSLSSGPTLSQTWSDLDPLGNWNAFTQTVQNALTQTRSHTEANEIDDISKTVGDDWPTPSYDANGNTTSFPDPRALTAELGATYDAWNRLVKLDDGSTLAEYQYDGTNRRTIKTADSVTRHYYHSDRWQVLEERTGSNTSADRQYVWGERYVDDLILRDHSSTRLYALTDALFNVVALTDDDGAVLERLAYQPYGQSEELDPDFTSYSGTNYQWEYRFTGRELDLESGLQLNRNRYLHMQLGRWMTRDPIRYVGSQWNLYEYVQGHALTERDPSGLVQIRCTCNYNLGPNDPEFKDIWVECTDKATSCCYKACAELGNLWGFDGKYSSYHSIYQIEPDKPGGLGDSCSGDWQNEGDYFDCFGCCVKKWEFWNSIAIGTGVSAIRYPKPHIKPGQHPTQSIWIPIRRKALPKCLRPPWTLNAARTLGRWSLYSLWAEGFYDLGATAACATYCSGG